MVARRLSQSWALSLYNKISQRLVRPVAGSPVTAGKSWSEFFIESCIRVLGFSTIGFVLLIFFFLLKEGLPVLWEVSPGNLFGTRWYPTFDIFGTLPLILGSAYVTIAAILIALPLGVTTAVFVREVAPNWAREILKPLIEVLAGIPSVVLGFFGMHVIAPLVRTTLNVPTGLSAFTGAVLLAYMSLPTIISVAEDALGRCAEELSGCGAGDGGHQLANYLAGGCPGRALGHRYGRNARNGAGNRRDDGGHDGYRKCGPDASEPGIDLHAGEDHDRYGGGRNGRGCKRERSLSRSFRNRHHPFHSYFYHQHSRRRRNF